jgi:hypothetical protein
VRVCAPLPFFFPFPSGEVALVHNNVRFVPGFCLLIS